VQSPRVPARRIVLPRPPAPVASVRLPESAAAVRDRRRLRLARLDWLLLLAVVATGTAYAVYGLRVYRTLHAAAFDLAFFDQILWNTAHGRWFETSYVAYNFLGQHFEPVLLPFAALYRLGAGPQTLIVAQAAGAALAALPLYAAGRRLLPAGAAALLACAYLLTPALQRGVDFGFHPDLFEPLAAFGALAALLWRRDRLFLLAFAALLLLKEDAFLVALALGWIALLRGRRGLGLAAMAAALLWGALVLGVAMPALRHGAGSDLAERYGYLGSQPATILSGALSHPDRVLSQLAAPAPATAAFGLLASFALLPLLAPEILLAAVPAALVGLLSTHPPQRSLDLQYGAPVLALIAIAALFGAARGAAWLQRPGPRTTRWPAHRLRANAASALAAGALCAALAAGFLRGPFPPERDAAGWRFADDGSAAALARVARLIPADATLSAQTGLAPHLSQRRVQWEFPRLNEAEYVIVQDGGIRSSQSVLAGYDQALAALPARGYDQIAIDGPLRLFRRQLKGGR